jgi:hypothetical protein
MKARLLPAVVVSVLLGPCGAVGAWAQDKPAPEPAKPAAEPAVKRTVSEDDKVRIEEVRVRGETKSITVRSKIPGVAAYEIVPATGARDPSQPGNAPGQGQTVWRFPAF